ncbi:hypothetical protein H9Q70_010935 [Fusarium xylarioides]|nr:hypothetical protein H9Q70_010935 [Fusarium xylarioides]
MKRPACEHDNSLEDTKIYSEKRPRMEQVQIWRHQSHALGPFIQPAHNDVARPCSLTPPLQDYDFPDHRYETVHGMDLPTLKTIDILRNHRPLSPAASDASTSASDDVSITDSHLSSRPQSPSTGTTCSDEDCISIMPRSRSAERTSSPLVLYSETHSESPPCSVSPEKSQVPPILGHNITSASTEKNISCSNMSSEIKPNAHDRFEQQRLAIGHTILRNRERTQYWLMSSDIPDIAPHGSLENFPIVWKDRSSSDVGCQPILPEVDVQKPSMIQRIYTAMEVEPSDFGLNSTTIASLPECTRAMIMTFCTEPKDLLALISSSPVFLQPFCQNRRAIVIQIIKSMRSRFGGDMPLSCLMVARLRNMESKDAACSPETRKANAKRAIKAILSLSPKGPLLHPVYSLRHFKFISYTLDKAESVMTSYARQAWPHRTEVSKFGLSHSVKHLVLFKAERKRFMDAICLYDAYCTAFFSENAISSDDDTALRQSFLEEDGIPGEIINRFYSIIMYLHQSYRYWINIAIGKRHHCYPAMRENHSQIHHLEKHADQLINHFICSGPSVFRMLQDMGTSKRCDLLLRLLDRCETKAAYRQKITSTQGRGDKSLWAYREIAAGLTTQEALTAQHFLDPAIVRRIKTASPIWPTAGLPLRLRPNA